MGRKVNPIGFRLGYVHGWQSNWYGGRNYTELLHEDLRIRKFVMNELQRAGISKVEIERQANKVDVAVYTSKPGIVIGKQGANVDRIRKLLEGQLPGRKVHLKIEEIKTPELDARLVAESIGEQITRRVSYRRAMKHAVTQAMRRGAKGVKLKVSGRLGGAEMSRSVMEMNGRVPLQTLRANIDFGVVHAHTTYGRIGVKVWIYKGDMQPEAKQAPPQTRRTQPAPAPVAGDK
ncbi:MAG TPA: 30S ribosomal protein S3 [Thermomicrobiales bacterium]|jgi:small subunit ribosomal protein S3